MNLDTHIFDSGESRRMLEEQILPSYIAGCRWFGGKARGARRFTIAELWTLPGATEARLAIVRIEYGEGPSDFYQLPLQLAHAIGGLAMGGGCCMAGGSGVHDAGRRRCWLRGGGGIVAADCCDCSRSGHADWSRGRRRDTDRQTRR